MERHTERENLNYKDGQTFIKAMKGKTQENLKQPEIALRKFVYVSKPMTPLPPRQQA